MKTTILTLLAVAMIGLGSWQYINASFVSSEDRASCEDAIQAQYPDNSEIAATLIEKCSDPGMAAMMISRSSGEGASEAAQAIAFGNRNEIASKAINFGLIGLGVGLLAAMRLPRRRKA